MRLVQVRRLQWVVYDDDGMIVIVTSNRKIAERYLNGREEDSK